jgi:hypothetical protein
MKKIEEVVDMVLRTLFANKFLYIPVHVHQECYGIWAIYKQTYDCIN